MAIHPPTVDMCVGASWDICRVMRMDTCMDTCTDMFGIDVCMGTRMVMSMNMRLDACIGMLSAHMSA